MTTARARTLLLAAGCLISFLVAAPATAREGVGTPRAHLTPDQEHPETAELWQASVKAEAERRNLDAAGLREKILARHPDQVHTRWRAARDLIRAAEDYLATDPKTAIELVKRGRTHARAGRRVDPTCAECCFYDFANLAREAATSGLMSSLPLLREMKPVIDACIASPPTWRDSDWQTEEAALYFGASQFYRLTPDSAVVEWVIGFRGDIRRAVAFSRKADASAPDRIDLRTELGTSLLCLGDREDDPAAVREGKAILAGVNGLEDRMPSDAEDRERAAWLARHPDEACSAARAVKLD